MVLSRAPSTDTFLPRLARFWPDSASTMAPAATSCHACGKSGCKLLRCGRCRNVWFCNRECQVVAASQGHSGANCCPADKTPTRTDAEVAPRVPNADGPSTTEPGVISASLTPAVTLCHTCGKSEGKLLLCSRCRNAWFCSRDCQIVARKELGHRGANCRAADGAQSVAVSASPSQPSTPVDREMLIRRYVVLEAEIQAAQMKNTRIGNLAAAEKLKQAATLADLIGGAEGAANRAESEQIRSTIMYRLGDMAAAAQAACSCLRGARAAGNRTMLVTGLFACGTVARDAPGEMVKAERERAESRRGPAALRRMAALTSHRRGGSACRPHRPPSSGWALHTARPHSPSAKMRSQPPVAEAAPPPPTPNASRR